MTGSASLSNSNFQVVDIVSGTAKAQYFLGIGGLNKAGLLLEARKNFFQSNKPKKGQVLANLSVDYKTAFYLIYWQTTATITADLVDFNNSDSVSVDKSPDNNTIKTQDLAEKKIAIEIPDVYEPDFKLKEEVMISSYGQYYIGTIEAITPKRVYIYHLLRNGSVTTTEKPINNVFKLNDNKKFGKDYGCTIGAKTNLRKLDESISGTVIAIGKKSFLVKYNNKNGNEKLIEISYDSEVYTFIK